MITDSENIQIKITNNHLYSLSWLRAIASLMVCIYHISSYVWKESEVNFFLKAFKYGNVGVFIFFVISGFVIPYSMYVKNYKFKNFKMFILKRTLRIEPPYVLFIFIFLTWDWYCRTHFWSMSFDLNWKMIFLNVTYLAPFFKVEWINVIFWTLAIEFQFYILMGVLYNFLINNRFLKYLLYITICCIGFLINPYFNTVFHKIIYFIIGFETFLFFIKKTTKYEYVLSLVLSCMFIYFLKDVRNIPFVLFTSLGILFFNFKNPLITFLGNISYSLYLSHGLVAGTFVLFFKNDLNTWSQFIFALGLVILFSSIYYYLVERVFLNISKKIKYN